jgi:hypothetical protein
VGGWGGQVHFVGCLVGRLVGWLVGCSFCVCMFLFSIHTHTPSLLGPPSPPPHPHTHTQFDQQQKARGLPTSDELQMQSLLEKASLLPGSPFLGKEEAEGGASDRS